MTKNHKGILSRRPPGVHKQIQRHNGNDDTCFDETLLCLLQMTPGMFVQPYEGWWVSHIVKTTAISF